MVCIRLRQENCKPDKIPLLRADICALLQVDLQASRLLLKLWNRATVKRVYTVHPHHHCYGSTDNMLFEHQMALSHTCYLSSLIVFEKPCYLWRIKSPRATWSPFTQILTCRIAAVSDITGRLRAFWAPLRPCSLFWLLLLWPSMQSVLRLGHLFLLLFLCFLLHEGIGLEQIHFLSILLWKHENYKWIFTSIYYSAL